MTENRWLASWYGFVFVVAAWIIIESRQWPYFVRISPGPALFPTAVGIGLLVASALGLLGMLAAKKSTSIANVMETVQPEGEAFITREGLQRIAVTLGGLVLFLVTARTIGFTASMTVLNAIVFFAFVDSSNDRPLRVNLIKAGVFAVIVASLVLFVFTLLGVRIPSGRIPDLLLGTVIA